MWEDSTFIESTLPAKPIVIGLQNVPEGTGPAYSVIHLRSGVVLHLNDEGICVWNTADVMREPDQCLLFGEADAKEEGGQP